MNARSLLPALAIGLLTTGAAVRLTGQVAPRPFQATDVYRLTFVGEPRLGPDARRVAFTVTTVVEDGGAEPSVAAIQTSVWRRSRRSAGARAHLVRPLARQRRQSARRRPAQVGP